jgi:hypothetical protein
MTVKPTLALEWEFGKQVVVLDGLSDHDLEPVEEIWEGIDYEHDKGSSLIHWLVLLP